MCSIWVAVLSFVIEPCTYKAKLCIMAVVRTYVVLLAGIGQFVENLWHSSGLPTFHALCLIASLIWSTCHCTIVSGHGMEQLFLTCDPHALYDFVQSWYDQEGKRCRGEEDCWLPCHSKASQSETSTTPSCSLSHVWSCPTYCLTERLCCCLLTYAVVYKVELEYAQTQAMLHLSVV